MTIDWLWEAQDQRPDPETGIDLVHLTHSAAPSWNSDGEEPRTSPDGCRVAIRRALDVNLSPYTELLVSDLDTKRLAHIARLPRNHSILAGGWSDPVWFLDEALNLCRFSWGDLNVHIEIAVADWDGIRGLPMDCRNRPALPRGGSATPDQRRLFYVARLAGGLPTLLCLDLQERCVQTVHAQPDMINPHLQLEPVAGRWVMVQINPGSCVTPEGVNGRWGDGRPVQLKVFPTDGTGGGRTVYGLDPDAPHCTGHECFIPATGEVVMTVDWPGYSPGDGDPPPGNLVVATINDAAWRVLPIAPCHGFHVGSSRCGRYFVIDELYGWPHRVPSLVVGSMRTGHCRTLLRDCGCYGSGGHVTTQPRPFFTADNRHVIFGRSPFGANQVAAARIPDGWLESLTNQD